MKRMILPAFLVLCFSQAALAQDSEISHQFGLGLQVTQHQNDFGVGLHATSPYFWNHAVAVRLRGNLMFYQHPQGGLSTWTPYYNLSLGIIGASLYAGEHIRVYGEGGAIVLFPSPVFSSQSMHFGGYGLFGVEFYVAKRANLFMEIGGMGSSATADLINSKPIYSNGMIINAGYRVQFE